MLAGAAATSRLNNHKDHKLFKIELIDCFRYFSGGFSFLNDDLLLIFDISDSK